MRINTLLLDKLALNFKLWRCQRHGRELQQGLQQCQADKGLLEYNRDQIFDRYYNKFKDQKVSHIKWKNRERNSQQLILNLNQQIFALQNNQPINNPNMAEDRRLPILKLMAPALAKFQPYIGREPPDEYMDRVIQSWAYLEGHMTVLENANAGDFDDEVKCNILKSMMGGKYAPVPANDPYTNNNLAINTPDTLRAWMRAKYQRETVGNQQSAIQRLTQEKYQPYDTPDTYEVRIRPLILGVADNDAQVLGFLKSHLTGDFYTWMRIANPGGINEFFTELKNMWLERRPNSNEGSTFNQVSVTNIPPVISQLETDSRQLQNKLHSDNDSIRAEIKSMIKSELALVPTPPQSTQSTSQRHEGQLLRPSQMEPGKIYRDPHLRLNDQEWLRMDDATDRLSALAGPSYLQTFMDTISKGGMSELSINKAIAKGISQGIKAVHDNNVSSQHRCSNCYSLGHNSRKCPYPRKRNRKNRKSRSKKRGSVNKVAVDSGSDTNSSDNDSSDNNSDSENSSSELESDSENVITETEIAKIINAVKSKK
ncbi:14250_t:CDS:2, partial [Entrophospora sp. SA101]